MTSDRRSKYGGQASLPAADPLGFFERNPNIRSLPPTRLCGALIAVGEGMAAAIEIVAANHVAIDAPVVIEGDGLLPDLFHRPQMRHLAAAAHVRGVFLIEPDEDALLATMRARDRDLAGRNPTELRTEARAQRLFGERVAAGSRWRDLPVLEPRPWATLPTRIDAAARSRP